MEWLKNGLATFGRDLTRERLDRVHASLAREYLGSNIIRFDPARGEIALVLVDLMDKFCHPLKSRSGTFETWAAARRAGRLAPEFRKAGIPIYAVHASPSDRPRYIGFTGYRPVPGDTLVRKWHDSAIKGSSLGDDLARDGRKLLLVGGVNTSFCVRETVLDAMAAGFEVCLLDDLLANGKTRPCDPKEDVKFMERAGASRVLASEFLKVVEMKASLPAPQRISDNYEGGLSTLRMCESLR